MRTVSQNHQKPEEEKYRIKQKKEMTWEGSGEWERKSRVVSTGYDKGKLATPAPLFRLQRSLSETKAAGLKNTRDHLVSLRSGLGGTLKGTLLGQVLYNAALLSREMEYFDEKQLVRDCLYRTPPLHPRRPLHQSKYGGISNISTPRRDQVLYRVTAQENDHIPCSCKHGCPRCRGEIRKVPRVIMASQLWLWILDGRKLRLSLLSSLQLLFLIKWFVPS
jgi:hypothetical protein